MAQQNLSLKVPVISIEDDEDDQFLLGRIVKQLNIPNEIRFFPTVNWSCSIWKRPTNSPF
jgi:hypothetical protein